MNALANVYKVKKFRGTPQGEAVGDLYREAKGEVNSKPAYEMNVLWALLQMGYRMEDIGYQVPIDGGRMSRNGLVVDFVLYTPSAIPIQVGATWWHKDSGEETLEDARILNWFGRLPIRIFDVDADTKEHALAALRRELG
jgi:hypothetical protein